MLPLLADAASDLAPWGQTIAQLGIAGFVIWWLLVRAFPAQQASMEKIAASFTDSLERERAHDEHRSENLHERLDNLTESVDSLKDSVRSCSIQAQHK